jgi:transcriptional regulator with XRE-family HTH domain
MNQLAAELGVSHSTVSRWLSGKYSPSTRSWQQLARCIGMSLEEILGLSSATQMKPPDWPEFREYALKKYPDLADEDLITMVEGILDSKKRKKYAKRDS